MLPCYAHALNRIIERFRATIAAIFSGHRHLDLFQVYYRPLSPNNASTMRSSRMIHNTSREAVAINYITPSLTSERGRPAFRIYDVDPATWAVVDYTVYVADYEPWRPGLPPHGAAKLTWKKYYSAREAYGTRTEEDGLSPAFWDELTVRMAGNETLFEEWWARRTRGSWVTPCRGVCRRREICYMRGGPDEGEGEGWEGCPGSVLTTRGRHGHGVAWMGRWMME
ncbi:uncharacterized protein BO72DRAFT_531992 [Aspergillus fijiensis CBS 313.89]|uniref:Calcineurin-like phosphoesterase domain-containing protein n=1 Tax=Aspergillus fijiensis CBS 313.89 TaxID=1448319 RepID=A0A8G1VTS5_9EURO|nr:uncharacterized protein BO72DRAFT_531992 [Aspergillus fijiensis CBS 313.89]RAK72392.1 hypothetical protein BO72DRAFT_531992 [Aspergillus fijiensis CBS 313.89]